MVDMVTEKDSDLRNCDFEIREQDRFLPLANVGRVMKKALPEYAKLSKESKECVQECASEFISFITSQAADKCLLEKRKTMNGEDVLWSMFVLGFENYAETLKIYLAKYREYEQEQASKRPARVRKKKPKFFDEDDYIQYEDDDNNGSIGEQSSGYQSEQSDNYRYNSDDQTDGFNIKALADKHLQPGVPELLPNLDDYIEDITKY
jgi:histone H3/H4